MIKRLVIPDSHGQYIDPSAAKAAIEMADEVAQSVKAHQLDFDSVDVALEEVEKASEFGLSVAKS